MCSKYNDIDKSSRQAYRFSIQSSSYTVRQSYSFITFEALGAEIELAQPFPTTITCYPVFCDTNRKKLFFNEGLHLFAIFAGRKK